MSKLNIIKKFIYQPCQNINDSISNFELFFYNMEGSYDNNRRYFRRIKKA